MLAVYNDHKEKGNSFEVSSFSEDTDINNIFQTIPRGYGEDAIEALGEYIPNLEAYALKINNIMTEAINEAKLGIGFLTDCFGKIVPDEEPIHIIPSPQFGCSGIISNIGTSSSMINTIDHCIAIETLSIGTSQGYTDGNQILDSDNDSDESGDVPYVFKFTEKQMEAIASIVPRVNTQFLQLISNPALSPADMILMANWVSHGIPADKVEDYIANPTDNKIKTVDMYIEEIGPDFNNGLFDLVYRNNYNPKQLAQILKMKKNNLSNEQIEFASNPKYNAKIMKNLRKAFENGLDVKTANVIFNESIWAITEE